MTFKFAKFVSLLAIAATALAAVWLHFHLPEGPVATHFGPDGVANGFMPRDRAFGFTPVALVLLTLLMWVLPYLMPKNGKLERSGIAYETIWIAVVALLVCIDGLIIATAVGYVVDMPMAATILIGLMYIILGNVLPKFRYNYVAGIRTPWTLSDERVWDRTHRFSGPVFMLTGVAFIISSFVVSPEYFTQALIVLSLVPVLISFAASYLYAMKR
jgi:uncharacterized membrane protein